ncbi:MAG: hypothetical protein ACTSVV_10635, partial [Promethearchaeota archaeon]
MTSSNPLFWICPKKSCNQKKIEIRFSKDGAINTTTFKEIILHFLKHLKKTNLYFGSIDIQKIFLENTPDNILTDNDKRKYSYASIIWKNRIRTALATIRRNDYIETCNKDDVPLFFNRDIYNRRDYRVRKRTRKFFETFEVYDDWELYEVKNLSEEFSESKVKKSNQISDVWTIEEEEENTDLEYFPIYKKVNLIIKIQNKLYNINNKEISFFIPEITTFLKTLDVDKKTEYLWSKGFIWRKKFRILNLDQDKKKKKFVNSLLLQLKNTKNHNININKINFFLDFDKNLILLNKQNFLINEILNVQYKHFRPIILNETDFYSRLLEIIKNPQ